MKLFFLLGNQLFSEKYLEKYRKDHIFYMAEDYQLCTEKPHSINIRDHYPVRGVYKHFHKPFVNNSRFYFTKIHDVR